MKITQENICSICLVSKCDQYPEQCYNEYLRAHVNAEELSKHKIGEQE